MKPILIHLFGIVVVFSSCSSAYKIGQTPDDVYYSPAPAQEEYVTSDNQQDKDSYAYNNSSNNIEDLAIRRGINDPTYRSNFSLGYGYYPYGSYGSPFYNPYNSYYNPYIYSGVTFYPYNNYYNSFYSPYNNYYSPYYNSYFPPLYYISKPGVTSNYADQGNTILAFIMLIIIEQLRVRHQQLQHLCALLNRNLTQQELVVL